MIRKINLGNTIIEYDFQYKNVKNINIRVKSDMTVHVSANRHVHISTIEDFMREKSAFILKAIRKFSEKDEEKPAVQRTEAELKDFILSFCREVYPYYEKRKISFPEIRFRKMISRWGSCHPAKKILTFSTNLIYASEECVKYVVWHEFTHFLQANHSKKFYDELSVVCPGWKEFRKMLRGINLKSV